MSATADGLGKFGADERSRVSNIVDLRDLHARDLMRGMLDRSLGMKVRATFFKLMSRVDREDMFVADRLLRESALFSHLPLREEFPRKRSPFLDLPDFVFTPQRALRSEYVVYRCNANAQTVADALASLDSLNAFIVEGEDKAVLAALLAFSDLYGHSIVLARKLAFILGHYKKETDSWVYASRMFAQYGVDSNNFGMMALADSIGVDFPYLDIKSSFDEFADCSVDSTASQKLSYLSFNPIGFDSDQTSNGIAASYSFSLLDAVYYVLFHRDLGLVSSNVKFAEQVEDAWAVLQIERAGLRTFFSTRNPHSDLQAFRAAPAFLEFENLRTFRAATQRLFDRPEARAKRAPVLNRFEDSFYSDVSGLRDLLPSHNSKFEPIPAAFDQEMAGSLARSCGLTRLADRDLDFGGLAREEMAVLMGQTFDVDRLLSTAALRKGAQSATDPFVNLILYILLRANSPATKDNYQFKHAFQNYVLLNHDGDILNFLDEVRSLSAEIVHYFITLLDETMLSQVPFLVRTADEVYETRARILEWHAEYSGDGTAKLKAKELRIDRKIAAVRGHLNETRLNIDSLRFRQWIEVSKLAEFSGYIRQDVHKLPPMINFKDRKATAELRLSAHRDPNLRALVAVMDCYKEFCTNADFGVASYLGRRIRHGTLRGTLLDGLPRTSDFDLSQSALTQYQKWLETFSHSIDHITSKLHFSGKGVSHNAVISSEIDSREKWDVLVVCLHNILEKAKAEHGHLNISLTIEQYCWYIFELELREVQEAIVASRDEFGSFKLKHSPGDTEASKFERAVNIALANEFNTVASWLRKPPNISPVAELAEIVTVVVREAKAEFPSFEPKTILEGGDLALSGSVYYHVYDALTIIVRNAAKHGAHPGNLVISTDVEDQGSGRLLRMTISTTTKPGDTAVEALRRMARAGLAGPTNADVVEGLSGMRKLAKMKLDQYIQDYTHKADQHSADKLIETVAVRLSGFVE